MPKFTYDDIVRVIAKPGGDAALSRKAWVVGIFDTQKEQGSYWEKFPPGVVYTIEFEDGSAIEVPENDLEFWE